MITARTTAHAHAQTNRPIGIFRLLSSIAVLASKKRAHVSVCVFQREEKLNAAVVGWHIIFGKFIYIFISINVCYKRRTFPIHLKHYKIIVVIVKALRLVIINTVCFWVCTFVFLLLMVLLLLHLLFALRHNFIRRNLLLFFDGFISH